MSNGTGRLPTVRHFIPCDQAQRLHGGGAYTLTRVRQEIPNPLGRLPPRLYAELHFYLVLSGGTGRHTFEIQQVCLRDQTRLFRWPPFKLNLGPNPTAVHEHAQVLTDVVFWETGQCEFLLYSGSRQLAVVVIEVK